MSTRKHAIVGARVALQPGTDVCSSRKKVHSGSVLRHVELTIERTGDVLKAACPLEVDL